MKKMTLFSALLLATTFAITSCNDNEDDDVSPNDTDRNFMSKAGYANRNEVDFAQLALSKSSNDSVKNFAQMMITDHTAGIAGLDTLGTKFSFSLPTTIDSVHAAMKTQLSALSGYRFDTAYMNGQIKDHTATIDLFQNELSQGRNPDVRGYASRNLPHIQLHKQRADSIREKLK